MAWQPSKPQENKTTLNEYELKELSIIKQAILKSAIEGGVITKNSTTKLTKPEAITTAPIYEYKYETDEEFIARWVKFVRRNEERDYKMFFEQELPF